MISSIADLRANGPAGRRLVHVVACLIGFQIGLILVPSRVLAADPAVAVFNYQAGVGYRFEHVEESDARFFTFPFLFNVPEEDIHRASAFGRLTVPVSGPIGARAFLSPGYVNRQIDDFSQTEIDGGGISIGGDLFVRNPERFEIGVGPRFDWATLESDGFDQDLRTFGGELGVRGFLPDFGVGPLDLQISGAIGDRDVDQDGGDFSGRTSSAAGGVVLYPFDRSSIHFGGVWTSEPALDGSHFESRFGVFELDFLLAKSPAWVVGPRVSAGERDRPFFGPTSVDQTFYSIGFELSASFPGADSLVVLRRRYQ